MNRGLLTALFLAVLVARVEGEDQRTWTDSSGKKSVTAKATNVVIHAQRPDGKAIELKWESLSKDDQKWVLDWLASKMSDDSAPEPKSVEPLTPEQAMLALRRAGIEVANDGKLLVLREETFPLEEIANTRFLPKLDEVLILSRMHASEHLAAIGELPTVTKISIAFDVSNADLRHLSKFKNLTFIHITSEKVTDAGLIHLHSLKNVEDLRLVNTKVTKAGLKKLYVELPKCVAKLD